MQYMKEIIHPYFARIKLEAGRSADQKCIIIIDCWAVHKGADFLEHVRDLYPYIIVLFVPAGCTGIAQVMDLCVNRTVKSSMRASFATYLAAMVSVHAALMKRNQSLAPFSFSAALLTLKPLLPEWVWTGLQRCTAESIQAGWKESGISRAWDDEQFKIRAAYAHADGLLFAKRTAVPEDTPDAGDEAEDAERTGQ